MGHFYSGQQQQQLRLSTGPDFFQAENAALIDQKRFSRRIEVRLARASPFELRGAQCRSVLGLSGMALVATFLVSGALKVLSGGNEPTTPPHHHHYLSTPTSKVSGDHFNGSLIGPGPRSGHRSVQSSWIFKEAEEVPQVKAQGSNSPFCNTVECQRAAAFLEQQLDPTFSPCNDLYKHVCRRWQEKHAKTATARHLSSYSVDDAVLDSYRQKLARRLSVDNLQGRPFRGLRSFFRECTRGTLTSRDEVEEIKRLVELGSSPSVVAMATTIVKLARMGFSPFFDVSVSIYQNVFRIRLLKPAAYGSDKGSAKALRDSYEASYKQRALKPQGSAANSSATFNDTEHKLFLRLLGRIFCTEIVRTTPEADKRCSLDSASTMTPFWNYTWYKSDGMELLTRYLEQDLESLLPEPVNPASSDSVDIRQAPLDSIERRLWKAERGIRDACLSLMARHDPYLLSSWSAINQGAAQTENFAREALGNIVKVVNRRFSNSSDLSTLYGLPAVFNDDGTALAQYHNDLYGKESEGCRLLRFLRNSTWKLWFGQQVNKKVYPLSTLAATFETAPQVIEVPEPVFNLTAMKDPWLRRLAIARYAPRILGTLFLGRFSEELKTSRFAQCASRYLLSDSDNDFYRQLDVELGTQELAAFHTGLDLYRSEMGGHTVAVPGTDLDSDSLFLFSYVYNQCEAVSKAPARKQATPFSEKFEIVQRRRGLFPKISTIFAKVLLPGCKDSSVEMIGCGVDDDAVGLSGNETESIDKA
ncbi:hypothetical protein V5799_016112 [Amblyomma americanum]|uniref:Uncharacterized protein n=1 Tax=Amblyomma americanum TaxID=6943 RepID=A0AAQ4F601_AMBAM